MLTQLLELIEEYEAYIDGALDTLSPEFYNAIEDQLREIALEAVEARIEIEAAVTSMALVAALKLEWEKGRV